MRGLPQVPFDSAEAVRLCAGSTMSCRWRRQAGQSCQAKTALADTGNSAHPADREAGLLRPDEAEGHPRRALPDRWRSPATSLSREEGAAFLKMSLFAGKMPPDRFLIRNDCFRTAFLRRSLFHSASTSTGAPHGSPTSRSRLRQRINADSTTPGSSAIPRHLPTAGQRQTHRLTPKLRHRSVRVSHGTRAASSVGALHISRASAELICFCWGEVSGLSAWKSVGFPLTGLRSATITT